MSGPAPWLRLAFGLCTALAAAPTRCAGGKGGTGD